MTFQRNPPANGLYRSTDGGAHWEHMNNIDTRPFYYSQVRVDPKNPDRVYFSSTELQVSNDGGKTTMNAAQGVHVDDHGMWIDPNDPERWVIGERRRHRDHLRPRRQLLVSAQPADRPVLRRQLRLRGAVQHLLRRAGQRRLVRTEPAPQHAGEQHLLAHDLGRRRLLHGAGSDGPRHGVGREPERRHSADEPPHRRARPRQQADVERALSAVGGFHRHRARRSARAGADATSQTRIDALRAQQKQDSADLPIRYNWESPYFLSPHNPQVFYLGGSRVLKSTKRGEDLYPISPDLSVKTDPAQERMRLARLDTVEKYTGGITLDITGAEAYGTVVALAGVARSSRACCSPAPTTATCG